jgi:hypothetical protein
MSYRCGPFEMGVQVFRNDRAFDVRATADSIGLNT